MLSKTKIYIDKESLEIIAQDSTISNNYYKNIIEIFRTHADLYLDLTDEELESIREPIDFNNPGDIYTFIEGKSLPWPASGCKCFNELNNKPEINGNVIYILNTKEDADRLKNTYGVLAVYIKDINDDIFYYEFAPNIDCEKVPVNAGDAWKYIFKDESLPPSNSMVISDSNLLTNNKINNDTGSNHFCGLVNLKELLNVLLPQSIGIPYYILILCPPSKNLEEGKMRKIVKRWIRDIKQIRPYTIVIEFLITKKTVHSRDVYSNYYRAHFDRGIYVFEPWTNRIHKEGTSHNEIDIYSYLSAPFRRGKSILDSAMVDINIFLDKYKSFLKGIGDPYLIDIDEAPLKQEDFEKNRILF